MAGFDAAPNLNATVRLISNLEACECGGGGNGSAVSVTWGGSDVGSDASCTAEPVTGACVVEWVCNACSVDASGTRLQVSFNETSLYGSLLTWELAAAAGLADLTSSATGRVPGNYTAAIGAGLRLQSDTASTVDLSLFPRVLRDTIVDDVHLLV